MSTSIREYTYYKPSYSIQYINWKTILETSVISARESLISGSVNVTCDMSLSRLTFVSKCISVCVLECMWLTRNQITFVCKSAAFLQIFFANLTPLPLSQLRFFFHAQAATLADSQRATDSRHGIWSPPNLSQWYADKTNKYQVSLFLFPFPFSPAFLSFAQLCCSASTCG